MTGKGKTMKKEYEELMIEVLAFEQEDVITASAEDDSSVM